MILMSLWHAKNGEASISNIDGCRECADEDPLFAGDLCRSPAPPIVILSPCLVFFPLIVISLAMAHSFEDNIV
jgi:hypothetical protein